MSTAINGIFQGDIVIRSAVVQVLQEVRQNPSLIDDVLASLPKDDLTAGRYGTKTIAQCKAWLLNTEIPVRLGLVLAQLKSPMVAIELNQNAEEQATLGDVNYETSEPDPRSYAVSYVTLTVAGTTTTTVVSTTNIAEWMPQTGKLLINGTTYSYTSWVGAVFTVSTDPTGEANGSSIYLVDNLKTTTAPVDVAVPTAGTFLFNGVNSYAYTGLDRANGVFYGLTPAIDPQTVQSGTVTWPWRRALESVHARESYNVTVLVEGEPEYLLFLYSIILFGILRRKEDLLDARGYTRMTWQVGVAGTLDPSIRENFFTRAIQLTGFVQHGWPKYDPRNALGLIETTDFGLRAAKPVQNETHDATSSPQTPTEPPPTGREPFSVNDWADRDMLSGKAGT